MGASLGSDPKSDSQFCEVMVHIQSVLVPKQPDCTKGRPAQGQQHQPRNTNSPHKDVMLPLVAFLSIILPPEQPVIEPCMFLQSYEVWEHYAVRKDCLHSCSGSKTQLGFWQCHVIDVGLVNSRCVVDHTRVNHSAPLVHLCSCVCNAVPLSKTKPRHNNRMMPTLTFPLFPHLDVCLCSDMDKEFKKSMKYCRSGTDS